MSADFVAFAVLLLLGVLALMNLPRYWLKPYWPEKPGVWWPYGEGLWRGFRRSEPVIVVGFLLFVLVILGGVLFVPESRSTVGDFVRPIEYVLAVFIIFFGTAAIAVSIVLWNRPSICVPPSLRREAGLLARNGRRIRTER